MTIKLDAIARNQSISQYCASFLRAPASKQDRMRSVLNAAQQRLRKVRRYAVQSLARRTPDLRASMLHTIDRMGADIRIIERVLNGQPSGTLADVWPSARAAARRARRA